MGVRVSYPNPNLYLDAARAQRHCQLAHGRGVLPLLEEALVAGHDDCHLAMRREAATQVAHLDRVRVRVRFEFGFGSGFGFGFGLGGSGWSHRAEQRVVPK